MKKNKKNLILMLLMLIVCGMGIGYSILSRELKIEGTATIDPNFDVAITGINSVPFWGYSGTYRCIGCEEKSVVQIVENKAPTFTATTATFDVTLGVNTTAGYEVKIENKGSIPAIINDIVINKTGSKNIELNTLQDIKGYTIEPGEGLVYYIELSYDASKEVNENELTSNITITFDVKQKVGNEQPINKPFIVLDSHSENSISVSSYGYGINQYYISINGSEYMLMNITNGVAAPGYSSFLVDCSDNAIDEAYNIGKDLIEGKNIVKFKAKCDAGYSNEITLEYHKLVTE